MKQPHSSGQLKDKMASFIADCRKVGLKVTHQRTEIFHQLLINPDHPTVETLHKRLLSSLPTISLDTVYRTLTTLEQHGFVSRIQTNESQARFEVIHDQHHHLICGKCRKVMDFDWPDADLLQPPEKLGQWGRIESKTIVIYGTCKLCLKN